MPPWGICQASEGMSRRWATSTRPLDGDGVALGNPDGKACLAGPGLQGGELGIDGEAVRPLVDIEIDGDPRQAEGRGATEAGIARVGIEQQQATAAHGPQDGAPL